MNITDAAFIIAVYLLFAWNIFYTCIFYPISGVVDELNRQSALRNFTGISEVPSENQVYEYFSRYGPKIYCEIANAILRKFTDHTNHERTVTSLMQHQLNAISTQ